MGSEGVNRLVGRYGSTGHISLMVAQWNCLFSLSRLGALAICMRLSIAEPEPALREGRK
jgi:hypothetical protein